MPLLLAYVDEINDDEVIFRNFQGQRFSYKLPKPYDGSGTPDIVLRGRTGPACLTELKLVEKP